MTVTPLVLDHVAFGTRDVDETSAAMRALGFEVAGPAHCEWEIGGRRHSARARCVVLPNQYLDFIEISDERWADHLAGSPVYARGAAPTGVVLSGVGPDAATVPSTGGPPAADPYPITRVLETDPPARVEYEFQPLADRGLPLGLIADSAPGALRRPGWLAHPNGAERIAEVHLRVPSLADARAAVETALSGLSCIDFAVDLGPTRLLLHEAPTVEPLAAFAAQLPAVSRPQLLALVFRVASLAAAADALRAGGVEFTPSGDVLAIAPERGFGTGLLLLGR